MEDPIFDAIFALCTAAEQEGFVNVADALELVLDVYLIEREQLRPVNPVFRSARAAKLRRDAELKIWKAALGHDMPSNVRTSSPDFPLMHLNSA